MSNKIRCLSLLDNSSARPSDTIWQSLAFGINLDGIGMFIVVSSTRCILAESCCEPCIHIKASDMTNFQRLASGNKHKRFNYLDPSVIHCTTTASTCWVIIQLRYSMSLLSKSEKHISLKFIFEIDHYFQKESAGSVEPPEIHTKNTTIWILLSSIIKLLFEHVALFCMNMIT